MVLNLVAGFIVFIIGFFIACYCLYVERMKSVVIVDFDTFIVDMTHLKRKAEIYVKNNKNKSFGEYIGRHIHEQIIRPDGIKQVLELQKQLYPLFFITERHENLRIETVKVLNDWGIKGPLYMGATSKDISIELVSSAIKQRGKKVFKTLRYPLSGCIPKYTRCMSSSDKTLSQ